MLSGKLAKPLTIYGSTLSAVCDASRTLNTDIGYGNALVLDQMPEQVVVVGDENCIRGQCFKCLLLERIPNLSLDERDQRPIETNDCNSQ